MSNESDGIKKSKIKKQSDGINCQVAFCRNKHFKGSNISFFRFPKNDYDRSWTSRIDGLETLKLR